MPWTRRVCPGRHTSSRDEAASLPGFTDHLSSKNAPREPGDSRAEVFHRAFRQIVR